MNSHKEKISHIQLTCLIILFTIGSAILFIPSLLAGAAKQDAWISAIVGTIFGVLLVLFYYKLYKLFPEKSLFESATHVLGRWVGGGVILLIYIYLFTLSTLLLWDLGDFLKTQIIVETPIEVIFTLFMLTIIYSVRLGLENIARSSEIFLPWVVGLFLIMILLLIGSIEQENVLPLIEKGIKPITHGSYYLLAFPYLELFVFLMITPYVNKDGGVKKAFVLGTVIGGLILIASTLFCIIILGADVTARHAYPVFVLGKKVSIGDFLERVEVFIAIIWFLSIYFKLAIIFHIMVTGLSNLFHLKDYRPLTLPLGMLTVVMTPIMFTSSLQLQQFDKEAFFPLSYIVGLILPFIIYITAVLRKKRKESEEKTTISN